MAGNSLQSQAKKGLIWSSIGTFSTQGVGFAFGIILARLLSPKEYGVVAMLGVFIAISDSLINSGFTQALVRKTDRTETDCSTVFYFNIVTSLILYGLCFLFAPSIASFYKMPELVIVLRVQALILLVHAFGIVQRAIFVSKIDFKTTTKASWVSIGVSGCVGLVLATLGFSYWALIWQHLVGGAVSVLTLWYLSKWRPIWVFSWQSFRQLFSFGSKLLLSGLLNTVFANIRPLVIGRIYNAADLGTYSKAGHFISYGSSNLTSILGGVSYPLLCQIQQDDERLAQTYRKLIRIAAFVVFPATIGISAVSDPLVLTLIGEKWAFSAKLLGIMGFAAMWYPISSLNLNLLQVKGRSDLFLYLEIVKKIFSLLILLVFLPFGLVSLCYGGIVMNLVCIVINTFFTGKLIHVGLWRQLQDIFPTLILTGLMYCLVRGFLFILPIQLQYVRLILSILVGAGFYLGCAKCFRFPELQETWQFIKRK